MTHCLLDLQAQHSTQDKMILPSWRCGAGSLVMLGSYALSTAE